MSVNETALKRMITKVYKYKDLTVSEIVKVTTRYTDLKPLMDSYVSSDGCSVELLSLSGTVPVGYRGNMYNIPIRIWLPDSFPFNPPTCSVKPTSSMMIKTGKHVDDKGKIYLPYLHEWKHPLSNLLALIQEMIGVFGEEPPVFSRPATQPQNCLVQDCSIGEDTIRASLQTAVCDKLRWRMQEEMERSQAELDALRRMEDDLRKGHQRLQDMLIHLGQEMTDVDKNINLLKQKDEQLQSVLEKMESQSESTDIDDIIVPTAPLYRQILNLYAEENAIEDTVFYLAEALHRGVVNLEVFLRHVRLLSRRQFQLRRLMQKARKTAGLTDLY
uniref:Tumor susceptibility gene 101 protein n=2 Tax=Denticeps clupeoides TaxID=299321 RepID=A0AAY4C030_9TELE